MSLPRYKDCLTAKERFWAKVDVKSEDECWPWLAYKDYKGYGRIGVLRVSRMCTVVCYKLTYGDYPDKNDKGEDITVDHICKYTSCCNPKHLQLVTRGENTRLGDRNCSSLNTAKTHCPLGHELIPDNIYVVKGKWRRCKTCAKRQRMETYWRSKNKTTKTKGAD